ncbi:probable WRKY transcription factor 20 [Phragmites australis]|uniref:probable WRKY transcription factor 20 n=1 Tax=Phragmites australis TaxID=29695 RepID=UPI002D787E5A|nr:probable WRKY transcription factor 20 [Phragmites australis]XP_062225903.1 probable WRKY transcription factor 20 [Phragmites australis]XP_062225904.1 probable WRKY transcription factor 20 [Phragmites australis]
MDGHLAMEEWKDPKPGPQSLMPGVLTRAFPPDTIGGHHNDGAKAGFEKHGLSVAISSPREDGRSLPMTPQFGQKSGARSSLAERMQSRAGFSVAKLSMPFITAVGADNSVSGAPSPYLTIPPGLSPATLLESPVFLSNAMGQASPTTGKLLMLGGSNDNDPIRFEGPPLGECTGAFSFKPLELKPSLYTSEENKECLCNNQHPSLPSTQVSVKTETNIQTVQEANLLGQQKLNGQTVKSCSHDSKLSHLAPDTAAGNEHLSPPDQGQTADEGDARGDYPAMATTAPAEDGYSWRKYGQKQVKHSEYPRSYYKCTHPNCQVKKKVERSHEGHITEIIYKGTHNHPKPAQSRRPGVPPVHPFGDTQTDATDNPGSQANVGEASHLWHNNAVVQDLCGDGLDASSPPSVPGELCDSSASMQVHDGARFESPEGVDVTSAVSDEVDGDDRVTHGSMSQGGADAEGDELESKRRKLESYAIDMSTASRAVREPRVVIQTTSEVDILDDGYRWRKYGQKVVKGNPNPRSYYKCTHPGCCVRKHVERASHDLKSVITTYEGKHNHEVPAPRNSGHPSSAAMAAPGQAHAGARRPEHPPVQAGLTRFGGCGVPFGLPPRDPLAPMGNYPYSTALGPAALPSLPMPAGLGPVEGLHLPMLAPPLHPFLRQRQAMEAAGLVVPKSEAKGNGNAGGATASVYQQLMQRSRLPLGHQM